ncbi:MAG: hypothetical protein K2R93_04625 [Gemmatimonadaceae bacterium]|nr:hypothetical protein [Gemmatimonadaceae bacterium]
MRRMLICGLVACAWAGGLRAQAVPARDLWEFPLGAVYEPAALAVEPGVGLWNPATMALKGGERFRLGVVSLSAGSDQGVDGQLFGASYRRPSGVTLGLSVARANVAGLLRTDSDPQTIGDIPYNSTLVSVGAAREVVPHLTAGVAVRYRSGHADVDKGRAVAADLGVVADDLPWNHARVAVSSFLWRPGREIQDRPALLVAADARVLGPSAQRETRLGYSYNGVNRGAREQGPYVSGRFDRLEARAGWFQTAAGARSVSRIRSGLSFHYGRYVVGLAREEGAAGLGPVYQFSLSSIFQ